jgi:hypothetical protein
MDRVTRPCDVCGQSDDHPRHQTLNVVTREVQLAHFDCCAGQGCSACAQSLEAAPKGARHGAELIAHLTQEGP